MRPKLSEIARVAGVSEATVSRVLNGKPGVAAPTRRAVLDVLSDLGYADVPSRTHHTGLVGILTPELENPIFATLAQSLEAKLARRDYVSVICPSTAETINEQDYLDHLADTRAAGAVIVNGRYAGVGIGYEPYVALVERGLRVVLVNAVTAPCPVPSVSVDIASGAELGTRHLVSLGHRPLGCLVRTHALNDDGRLRRRVAGHHEHPWPRAREDPLSETLFTVEGGQRGGQLVKDEVTALVAAAPHQVEAVSEWGWEMGLVFQMTDDVLDLVADDAFLGKPAGSDMLEGTYTLPVLYAVDGPAGPEIRDLLARVDPIRRRWRGLLDIVRSGGYVDRGARRGVGTGPGGREGGGESRHRAARRCLRQPRPIPARPGRGGPAPLSRRRRAPGGAPVRAITLDRPGNGGLRPGGGEGGFRAARPVHRMRRDADRGGGPQAGRRRLRRPR